jgi:predicted HTH domain antitoxin
MSTFKIEIELPSELRQSDYGENEIRREIPTLLSLRRFSEGAITAGQAARILSADRYQFIDLLAREKIPLINLDDSEIEA